MDTNIVFVDEDDRHHPNPRSSQAGFTLIELIITIAIIGVLASMAYPSYLSYVQRTYRSAAKSTLLEAAQFMERYRSTNFSYVVDANATPVAPPALPSRLTTAPADNPRYTITVETPTAMQFLLKATPANWVDSKCGTLTLSNTGVKGQTLGDTATCWNK